MFEQDLTLPAADQAKVLASLDIHAGLTGGTLGVFAVERQRSHNRSTATAW